MFNTDQEIRDHASQHGLTERSKELEIRAVFPHLSEESEVFGDQGRLRMVDGIPGFVSSKYDKA